MKMKERGGHLHVGVMPNIKSATLREAVFKNIERGSTAQPMNCILIRYLSTLAIRTAWSHRGRRNMHAMSSIRTTAAVQGLNPLNAYPCVEKIHGQLSARLHFPLKPPSDAECDVRSFDFSSVVARHLMAFFNSTWFTGHAPSFFLGDKLLKFSGLKCLSQH